MLIDAVKVMGLAICKDYIFISGIFLEVNSSHKSS